MRVLIDHCIDWRIKRLFSSAHDVRTTQEMGWAALKNGELLDQAQVQFDTLLTVDRNIEHQQNLTGRQIAIVIMIAPNNRRVSLEPLVPAVEALLPTVEPGRVYQVSAYP